MPGSCAQRGIEDVLPDRGLRFSADDWVLPSVIYGKTQSSRGKYVLDGAPRPAVRRRDRSP
ncbi:hypothetical protein HMPREF1129_1982 [Actinomyces naeslundii str. Howell 279]|uniref:Uncharacterized protein n=1 Tax=Actinomyces naeslundii (strain ATCC 12104 / DSM 43013 / CCUG 2238 / JCM 8349 / NCTC 10301 / Howell 279) TaxID=1115803 RepID=J3JJW1_ACTNH|nr:hypothetical protein HMPREF1129_1982 [Actinomyces naeslundii str. Howell 279]